ncbi:hypothetical protein BHM03_00011311 [Ensete ventricosum]|uniref:Uncharacterized protein n=1 Tax=Ensete ventricosum TaxID=4639 RepID=A0A445MDE2_ENSVE|nr:hypothetical protein BHM03_00011311 [Ensete ventricosum]
MMVQKPQRNSNRREGSGQGKQKDAGRRRGFYLGRKKRRRAKLGQRDPIPGEAAVGDGEWGAGRRRRDWGWDRKRTRGSALVGLINGRGEADERLRSNPVLQSGSDHPSSDSGLPFPSPSFPTRPVEELSVTTNPFKRTTAEGNMAPHSILYKPPTFPSRSPSDVGLKQNPGAAPESGGNHGSLACLLPTDTISPGEAKPNPIVAFNPTSNLLVAAPVPTRCLRPRPLPESVPATPYSAPSSPSEISRNRIVQAEIHGAEAEKEKHAWGSGGGRSPLVRLPTCVGSKSN